MEKLRLNLDEITVTSFEAASEEARPQGTVEGRELLAPTRQTGCNTCYTCRTNCLPYC
ncbi:MAG TPA: hypothetical protein VJT67_06455 [Longimicrobiaceae bacterium]|nr:hypothetical protein [Longimicrobiaceae bacterium]